VTAIGTSASAGPTGPATPVPAAAHGESGATVHGPRACAPSKVVISLFASQVSYPAQSWPQFEVDVVSTGSEPCTFNVGARHLVLVIKAGSVQVWSSAACVQGRKSLVTDLVRGVPTVLPISWDRKASSPGCRLASSPVPAGAYAATASSGQLASNTELFRLR